MATFASHPYLGRGPRLAALFGLHLLLWSGLCACREPAPRPAARVLVLGLDGLDYQLTRQMIEEGALPTFARLARQGGFAPLVTTMPPQSPTAWATFLTGQTPGWHGIFDFVHRDPTTLSPFISTSRATEGLRLPLGRLAFPLTPDSITLLRREKPFWYHLSRAGVPATIIKVPSHFPPTADGAARVLAGMGTPDLLGTYGTFTVLTTDARQTARALSGGRAVLLQHQTAHRFAAWLEGPPNPYLRQRPPLAIPVTVEMNSKQTGIHLTLGETRLVLGLGEWSSFQPVVFPLPLSSIRGRVRVYLKAISPHLVVYLSPLDLDPEEPALPLSSPGTFARDLARAAGEFETLGIPEDTKALAAGVLDQREFLQQALQVLDQRERLLEHLLTGFDAGFLFFYFSSADQLSHIFWRSQDPRRPGQAMATSSSTVLRQIYRRLDQTAARTLRRLGPEDTLIIMSDHGFGPVETLVDLNAWLYQEGYLALRDKPTDENLGHIDWARTQAYGLGLNGLYLNLAGRERHGVVPPSRREELLSRLTSSLLALVHPETGLAAVTEVARPDRDFPGPAVDRVAPDLIVGFGSGLRVHHRSALGEVGARVFQPNDGPWGGDHCSDHRLVPGVLLSSQPLRPGPFALIDLAPTILSRFKVEPPPGMTGRPLFLHPGAAPSRADAR